MARHSAGIKVPNTVAIASLGGGVIDSLFPCPDNR